MPEQRLLPVYDDAWGPYNAALGTAALSTAQYRDTGLYLPSFTNGQSDSAGFIFQMPHRKKLGSAMASIHIHCIPLANGTPDNVDWVTKYFWANPTGVEVPVTTSWATSNTSMSVETTDQYKTKIHSLATNIAAPGSEAYSSLLFVTVSRPTGDAFAGDIALVMVDCHFVTDRNGSWLEYTDS